jgi:hypothetical protein
MRVGAVLPQTEIGRDPADVRRWATTGRADYVAAWQRLGATHLMIATMGAGYATVDDHLGALETALADLRRSGLHGAATTSA